MLADVRHDFVHTINVALDDLDPGALAEEMRATAARGHERLERAGVALEGTEVAYELDMAYRGQSHAVAVPVPDGAPSRDGLGEAFGRIYTETYGHELSGIPVRLLTLRTTVIGRRPRLDLSIFAPPEDATLASAELGRRPVWVGGAWHDTPVLDRLALPAGAALSGPCVLQQPDTTILVEPGIEARVDALGNVVLER